MTKRAKVAMVGCLSMIVAAPVLGLVTCRYLIEQGRRELAEHPEKSITTWAEVEQAYFVQMDVSPEGVETEGDWEIYKGSVTNKGDKTVTYWKLAAKFSINGRVVDTGFVNSAERLGPGESKKWRLMHRDDGTVPTYQWEDLKLER